MHIPAAYTKQIIRLSLYFIQNMLTHHALPECLPSRPTKAISIRKKYSPQRHSLNSSCDRSAHLLQSTHKPTPKIPLRTSGTASKTVLKDKIQRLSTTFSNQRKENPQVSCQMSAQMPTNPLPLRADPQPNRVLAFANFKMIPRSEYFIYEGQTEKGIRQGFGIQKFANGEKFIGGFQNDQPSGHGTYYRKGAPPVMGIWKEGVLVELVAS